MLFCQLTPASRRLLGVPGTATTERGFQAAYRRVRYCFHAIVSTADPSALPKNRRLTDDELQARTKPMAPGQAAAARDRLESLVNALLEASVSVLSEDERAAFGGGTGLDATPVPLFSRGPSKRTGLCASDPDGGWYVREGDHREREDDKGKPLRKLAWALEATIAVTARPPGAPPAHPNLAIGLAMTRPGEDPGGTGARVLASVAARGHEPGWLGYDRAYTAALPGRFHLPARALGYSPVMDYRADQLGIQANSQGALLVEGAWYCPALPEPLITATASLRDHLITRELYDQQIAARARYQLKRKDGPDADGYQRLSCPAAGGHPGLMCPLRRASLSPRDGRPKVLQPPQEPPRLCRQTAITIAPDVGARYRQDLPYGSPAWHARYATLRNTIEGLNGYAKDTAHQALAAASPPPRPRHPAVHLPACADGRRLRSGCGPQRPGVEPHARATAPLKRRTPTADSAQRPAPATRPRSGTGRSARSAGKICTVDDGLVQALRGAASSWMGRRAASGRHGRASIGASAGRGVACSDPGCSSCAALAHHRLRRPADTGLAATRASPVDVAGLAAMTDRRCPDGSPWPGDPPPPRRCWSAITRASSCRYLRRRCRTSCTPRSTAPASR